MKSNSEMATKFFRYAKHGMNLSRGTDGNAAVRNFAKWLTTERQKEPKVPVVPELPVQIPVTGGSVHVAESCGRVEVVLFQYGKNLRLLSDETGIHVGTIKKD